MPASAPHIDPARSRIALSWVIELALIAVVATSAYVAFARSTEAVLFGNVNDILQRMTIGRTAAERIRQEPDIDAVSFFRIGYAMPVVGALGETTEAYRFSAHEDWLGYGLELRASDGTVLHSHLDGVPDVRPEFWRDLVGTERSPWSLGSFVACLPFGTPEYGAPMVPPVLLPAMNTMLRLYERAAYGVQDDSPLCSGRTLLGMQHFYDAGDGRVLRQVSVEYSIYPALLATVLLNLFTLLLALAVLVTAHCALRRMRHPALPRT